MTEHAVILGGAGFLGSTLAHRLLASDIEVTVVDDLSTGRRHDVPAGAHFIEADIRTGLFYPSLRSCTSVYNLACPASPPIYQADPIRTTLVSVIGSLNAADLANRVNATLIQASTSEVYGNPTEHPQTEQYLGNVDTLGIRACYDEGKRCAEAILCDHHRQRGTDIKIARIFNTYGPRMRSNDKRLIPELLDRALNGRPLLIHGDGKQTRSLCYVDDLLSGLIALAASDLPPTKPVNLGNDSELSVLDVADAVIRVTGSKAGIVYSERPLGDPDMRRPDLTRARQYLGWAPTTSFDDGLALTIAGFRR